MTSVEKSGSPTIYSSTTNPTSPKIFDVCPKSLYSNFPLLLIIIYFKRTMWRKLPQSLGIYKQRVAGVYNQDHYLPICSGPNSIQPQQILYHPSFLTNPGIQIFLDINLLSLSIKISKGLQCHPHAPTIENTQSHSAKDLLSKKEQVFSYPHLICFYRS